jgi:integral membrane protein (TIGR01906 family)
MNQTQNKFIQLLFSLCLCLFIIFASVKFTVIFKPLYYFDIGYLNIVETSTFSKAEIIKNYDYVIDYMSSPMEDDFILPSISYSKASQIHFYDVKKIFHLVDILFAISSVICIIGAYFYIKNKSYTFLKWSSYMLLALPSILILALLTNANSAFTIFHKIFFRNDYWILNTKTDPIINIMPQKFFYHAAILIGFIIVLFFIIFRIVYKIKSSFHNNIN